MYGNKIGKVIKYSQYTITGSPYLTTFAQKYNEHTIEIPTSIDINKYFIPTNSSNSEFVIGWIGTSSTSTHLTSIVKALKIFSDKNKCIIRLIGFNKKLAHLLIDLPVEIIEWSEQKEVDIIQSFSVGIMPLIDAPFERGKCGFKLIQYMACGIPTISTPLETNIKINRDSQNLFATSTDEWVSAFEACYRNREKYALIGLKNRAIVEQYYSIQANVGKYLEVFNKIT
ncbi:MAG: glycosyltransferase [Saprospiraceae bacterium]|nr:glycosyltransferase [Saprospiraceae bacterium]